MPDTVLYAFYIHYLIRSSQQEVGIIIILDEETRGTEPFRNLPKITGLLRKITQIQVSWILKPPIFFFFFFFSFFLSSSPPFLKKKISLGYVAKRQPGVDSKLRKGGGSRDESQELERTVVSGQYSEKDTEDVFFPGRNQGRQKIEVMPSYLEGQNLPVSTIRESPDLFSTGVHIPFYTLLRGPYSYYLSLFEAYMICTFVNIMRSESSATWLRYYN